MKDDQKTENREPIKLRDGALDMAIWQNDFDDGKAFNTVLERSYKDKDDNWQKSHSIPERDLLKAARLYQRAYEEIQQVRDHDRDDYVQEQKQRSSQGHSNAHPRER